VTRRLLILNLILVAIVGAAVVRFYDAWVMFEATHQPSAVQPQPEVLPKLGATAPVNTVAPADWAEVPAHNLFSFDRTDLAMLEPAAPPPPPKPPGPKPFLFGTVTLGKDKMAMVGPGQNGNRSFRPMKIGEVIDGWTITEILDKSIRIQGNNIEDSVIMNDPSAQIPRDYTRTAVAPASVSNVAPPVAARSTAAPVAASPSSLFPGVPTSAQPTAPGRRRVIQMTPFGPREIEEPAQ
jgi:hypothetical protein